MNQRILKLGTRRSLLAWSQSSWVAREIERLNPGVAVELVGIDTRGDKIVDVSLRQVQGKEFFVAELDDALRAGTVDMTVHSMKDLSLERPAEFALAAIPRRENPRDVILFGPGVMDRLSEGRALRIGTSSPRRLENIPAFLESVLPHRGSRPGARPKVDLVEIRGNVNTRLARVHEPAGSERALDGVVLAFAGLIRLWADDKGRAELSRLLAGARWMVLPLRENPAAPAQGALAVECRAADAETRASLARLHDPDTAARVGRERQLLADWGGGCHQRFGATAIHSRELGLVMYVRGRKPAPAGAPDDSGEFVDEIRWDRPAASGGAASLARQDVWDGVAYRARESLSRGPSQPRGAEKADGDHARSGDLAGCKALFVAHARALPEGDSLPEGARVWTSGVPSWQRLAARGVWVEGCAEGFGFEFVRPILGEKVLQLPSFGPEWAVLTHDQAGDGWDGARVVATYRVPRASHAEDAVAGADAARALSQAKHLFWGSGSQFDQLARLARAEARHYCGPGKTAAHLRARGIEPTVFPSAEEWRKWLAIK